MIYISNFENFRLENAVIELNIDSKQPIY